GRLLVATFVRGDAWAQPAALPSVTASPLRAVIESPQVYAASKSKGNPNDLVDVALAAGAWAGEAARLGAEVKMVAPREWKGQLSKVVTRERARAVLAPAELAAVGKV